MTYTNINPIQWHEGMLLMPQHFQQADLRTESITTYYISHVLPFFWGVVQLKINKSLLTAGIFRPLELEVIMPDGLVAINLSQENSCLQVNLLPSREKIEAAPCFIYLCVPPKRGDGGDVSGDLPRYHSVLNAGVVDVNTGQQAIDIPRLIPNLSLQIGQEPPAHYISLPVAQVSWDAKSFSLTSYIPPHVQVSISSELGQLCDQFIQHLREKLYYLQQKVQSVKNTATRDPFINEMEKIRLKLVTGLIPFEAIFSAGISHPFVIYQALCTLAAQISGIKYGELPPRFEGYNHLDSRGSFSQVIGYVTKVLDEIEESYSVIPLTLKDGVFSLQLESSWLGDKLVFGARMQSSMTSEALLSWVDNCVIVTDKKIALAKDNRVLGAKRTLVSEVSTMNLLPTIGVQLFLVDVDPQYIDPKGTLCLFNVSDTESTRPPEIVLYHSNLKDIDS